MRLGGEPESWEFVRTRRAEGEVLRMVLRETMSLVAIGVAIGVPVALAASRLLSSMLFGVKTMDAATIPRPSS